VLLAYVSRSVMVGNRDRLLRAGSIGKVALGSVMLVIALATAAGEDRQAEAWLVNHSPVWLTSLTTRF
jgi:cytochrome c-type biogenesis protein